MNASPGTGGLPVTDIDRSRTFHDAALALRPVVPDRFDEDPVASAASRSAGAWQDSPPALRLIPLRRLDRLLARRSVAGRPGE